MSPYLVYIIGPPGAGKTTQCKMYATTRGIPHISTGQLLRSSNTCMDTIEGGDLVSTDTIMSLLLHELYAHDDTYRWISTQC